MKFSINSSTKAVIAPFAALLLLAGCAGTKNGPAADMPVGKESLTIAVLPVENLSGKAVDEREMQQSLAAAVQASGLAVLDLQQLEQFLTRHRVRYVGGIDGPTAAALQKETGAGAVLITSLELYASDQASSPVPKLALISRLVSACDKPEIAWMDSVGLTGDQSPGILSLGVIKDPKKLLQKAVTRIGESLGDFLSGEPLAPGRRKGTRLSYRSSLIGVNLRECSVAFALRTSRGERTRNPEKLYVYLNPKSDKMVAVNYAVTGGTAREGEDYALKNGVLRFRPGETVKAVEVDIRKGKVYDDDRTVEVSLSRPVNAVLGKIPLHTLTIVNSVSMPAIGFTTSSQKADENSGTVTVTAKLSAASGKDVTVPFSVSGTAVEQLNYKVLTPSPLQIKGGAVAADIQVELIDNGIDEEDKSLVIELGTPIGAVLGRKPLHTVNIKDVNPVPAVAFSVANSSGDEGAPAKIVVSLGAVSDKTVAVDYIVAGGTAARGIHYDGEPGTVIFTPGEKSREIEIQVRDNGRHDYDRTIELGLANSRNAALGEIRRHTYIIMNRHAPPEVTFGAASGSVREDAGTVTIPVKLSAVSGKDTVIPFSLTGTAGRKEDYELLTPNPVVIRAGSAATNLTLIVKDVPLFQEDKNVTISLGKPENATLGSLAAHTLTIIEKGPSPAIGFSKGSSSGMAGLHGVKLEVTLSTVSGKKTTVEYAVTGGTAKEGTDHAVRKGSLTFNPGETVKAIDVETMKSTVHDDDKTIELSLLNPVNAVLGGTSAHTYTIENTVPMPTVGFSGSWQKAAENSGTVTVTAELSAVSGKDVTVPFTLSGTAMEQAKVLTASPLTFKAGTKTAEIRIGLAGNGLNEEDKSLAATLGRPINAGLGPKTVRTVTVVESDPVPAVSFALGSSSGKAGASPVKLEVRLSAASGKKTTVEYGVTGGTARGSGKDYTLKPGKLTFEPGETSGTIEVEIKQSTIYDDDRTIEVGLAKPVNVVLGKTTLHTYTIMNAVPPPAAGFALRTSSGKAGTGRTRIEVTLSTVSGKKTMVEYAVTGGTAKEGTDHAVRKGSLTFNPGETVKAIDVETMKSTVHDDDKTIELSLLNPVNAVLGSTIAHTYTIGNTVPMPTVGFSGSWQKAAENSGTVTVTAELSAVSGKDVTVPFTLSGTAMEQANVLTASPLVFKAGTKTAEIRIGLAGNGLNEEDKSLVLTMGPPKNADHGPRWLHRVSIAESDPVPAVSFALGSSSGKAGASPVKLEVRLSAASGKKTTVEYGVTGGTARGSGQDYTLKAGSLTFNPGETAKTIELEIKQRTVYDEDRTIEVGLAKPVNAVLGEVGVHTYTIANGNPVPTVSFSESSQSVTDDCGTAVVRAQLSAISGKDVIVPFIVGGTAREKADFRVLTPSPLRIKAGETFAEISIVIVSSAVRAGDKQIVFTQGSPENAVPGSTSVHTLTINTGSYHTVSVVPFFNESSRKNAGQILMLHFVNQMKRLGNFQVIEPGVVRQKFLNMRVIMREGVSSREVDLISYGMDADLILTGKVSDYQDPIDPSGVPKVDFLVELIERKSKKVIWAAKNYKQGDEGVFFFNFGKLYTANSVAAELSSVVGDILAD